MPNDALIGEDDPTIALDFALLRNALSSTTPDHRSTLSRLTPRRREFAYWQLPRTCATARPQLAKADTAFPRCIRWSTD
jgi:hypothetical protein